MTEQIEPCPNPECRYEGPMRAFAYRPQPFHCVTCTNCDMQGPVFYNHDDAIAAWNAVARAVREATDWRQRAEAAEAAIAKHNREWPEAEIELPARPADGVAE